EEMYAVTVGLSVTVPELNEPATRPPPEPSAMTDEMPVPVAGRMTFRGTPPGPTSVCGPCAGSTEVPVMSMRNTCGPEAGRAAVLSGPMWWGWPLIASAGATSDSALLARASAFVAASWNWVSLDLMT